MAVPRLCLVDSRGGATPTSSTSRAFNSRPCRVEIALHDRAGAQVRVQLGELLGVERGIQRVTRDSRVPRRASSGYSSSAAATAASNPASVQNKSIRTPRAR
jgi:hypothetical protein